MALTKTDIDDIERLIATSNTIYQITNELVILEVKGFYGTKEYQEKLENLEYWLELEAGMFRNIATDYDKNKEYINYLVGKMKYPITIKPGNFVINSNPFITGEDLHLNRLYNRFIEQLLTNKERVVRDMIIFPPEMTLSDLEDTAIYKRTIYKMLAINYVIADLFVLTITLLNQEAEDNSLEKGCAIWKKYYFCVLFQEVEKTFLATKFAINPHPFMITEMCKKMVNISDEEAQTINDELLMTSFNDIIEDIARYKDEDLKDEYAAYKVNYRIIELRAKLILASDSAIEKMQTMAMDILKQIPDEEHTRIKQLIIEAFSYRNRDKNIPQIVSFGL